jgi:hypothetical protein
MDRSDWQIVEHAPGLYGRCVLSGFSDGPFLDLGFTIPAIDPLAVVNVDVLRDAARWVGMVDQTEHTEAQERIAALEALVDDLEKQLAAAEEFKQSVDTIVSYDYVARKKPGRKVAA